MKVLVSLIFLTLSFSALAEIIDGPANLRVAPKGKVAVTLNDSVEVYVQKKEGDWFKIMFIAYVSRDDYRPETFLKAGVELFNYRGESIGKSVNAFSDLVYFESGSQIGLEITLYTYKDNIVESSILENKVVELINLNKLNRSSLLNLEHLKIEKWSNVEGFRGGIVMEPLIGGPFPPGIRFIFFIHDQEVVAIAGNDKMKDLEFECLGMTEVEVQRLNIFYLKEQAFSKRKAFEKSLYAAFSRMH